MKNQIKLQITKQGFSAELINQLENMTAYIKMYGYISSELSERLLKWNEDIGEILEELDKLNKEIESNAK